MQLRVHLIVAAFTVLLASSVWAKGVTVKIVVSGDYLTEPVVITDEEIVRQFSIWSGPNSIFRVRGGEWRTDYSGTFINFPAGKAAIRPTGMIEFDVEFHLADSREGGYWEDSYRVRYAINPAESGGFFYLPTGNPFIYHGVEGNWLHSTQAWEELVRPTVESVNLEN